MRNEHLYSIVKLQDFGFEFEMYVFLLEKHQEIKKWNRKTTIMTTTTKATTTEIT